MTSSTLISRRIGRTLTRDAQQRWHVGGTAWRRRFVVLEMITATAGCVATSYLLGDSIRRVEAGLAAAVPRAFGVDRVAVTGGDSLVVTGPGGETATVTMTASTSALPAILALAALAVVALRNRSRASAGLLAASVFVLFAGQLGLIMSLLAGRYVTASALTYFHGGIGALLNATYTLIGLLIMAGVTMTDTPDAEPSGINRLPAWLRHRRVLPASVSAWLVARRDRRQVDHGIEHQTAGRRAVAVRDLAEQGLGTHISTLLAVAAHETEPLVLDALAGAVAAQQWEPAANRDVIALRLWARAWLMRAPVQGELPGAGRLIAVTGAGGPAGVAVIRALQAGGDHVLALDANPDAVGLRLAGRSALLPRADEDGYAEALLAVIEEYRPAALVCTVCEEYATLAPLTEKLSALGTKTWLPDPVAAEVCRDKARFAAALTAAGVAHPATAASAQEARDIAGPWVVKPARGRGSRDVVFVDDPAELDHAFTAVPDAIAQTRLTGREFTADALVDRDGTLLTCVPRWRDETRGGISVRGTTFDSTAVTLVVAAALRAVEHTGPANVQGFVADPARLDDPDAQVDVSVVEVNPRFSGGLPLTLAAGADVVGTYLAGVLDPAADLPRLTYRPDVRMARHFAEVYYAGDGSTVPDPLALSVAR